MFRVYLQSVLLLICLIPTLQADQSLLRNINNVILSDFQALREKESGQNFLSLIIDRLEGSAHGNIEVVGQFRNACGDPLNRSVCIENLNYQCSDISTVLHHFVKKHSAEVKITDLFPALVLYDSLEDCSPPEENQEHVRTKPTTAQAWGYGIGFVALICTIANIGGLMTPFMSKRYFQRMLLFCVALAVGTLAGTGLLVLIPESMHLTGDDTPIPDYHYKMSTVLVGIYFFYVSERIMKISFGREKRKKTKETGSDAKNKGTREVVVTSDTDKNSHSHFINNSDNKETSMEENVVKKKKEVSTVAWMILIGDALHNFVDGIAIGAAFTENVYLGVSVSLAIICEELPHELGDIAILLHAGLSMKRSLCYNFLAAVVCFLGLVIGILVGEKSDANVWIFAVAGGMFVYIALVDMLPEMASQYSHVVSNGIETPATAFIIQNVGLIIGYVIIMVLVLYGGNIAV